MAKRTPKQTYQLKVTLKGAKPPIWRRLLVPSVIRLDELHLVIQQTMGWFNCHLHQFAADGLYFGIPDDDFGLDFEVVDETQIELRQLLGREKDAMVYEYDFGDGWEHKIVLEAILPTDETQTLPACIKGKRACPPEDCGGVWGYENLLKILSDPSDPEHESMLEWIGGDFDAEAFDVKAANVALAALRTGR